MTSLIAGGLGAIGSISALPKLPSLAPSEEQGGFSGVLSNALHHVNELAGGPLAGGPPTPGYHWPISTAASTPGMPGSARVL